VSAVTERLELNLEDVKSFLRIVHNHEDGLISSMIDAARELADEYLNNPFRDATGANQAIPSVVKIWCMSIVADMFENRVNRLQSESQTGIGSQTWRDQIDYSMIAKHRLNPGL
jgi:uncharacterized phage protein (predicted DNA packaging)